MKIKISLLQRIKLWLKWQMFDTEPYAMTFDAYLYKTITQQYIIDHGGELIKEWDEGGQHIVYTINSDCISWKSNGVEFIRIGKLE